jgi:hypothetical protein
MSCSILLTTDMLLYLILALLTALLYFYSELCFELIGVAKWRKRRWQLLFHFVND